MRHCKHHTTDTGPHHVYTTDGELLGKFDDCPIAHIADDTWRWLGWYTWLDAWHKTPQDMGAPREAIDPRYYDAMLVLRAEFGAVRETQQRRRHEGVGAPRNYPSM